MEATTGTVSGNVVIISTIDQLRAVMAEVIVGLGVTPAMVPVQEAEVSELTTRQAKKVLKDKGYRVETGPYFNKLIKEHNVRSRKRGKENWYSVEDLSRVPTRK